MIEEAGNVLYAALLLHAGARLVRVVPPEPGSRSSVLLLDTERVQRDALASSLETVAAHVRGLRDGATLADYVQVFDGGTLGAVDHHCRAIKRQIDAAKKEAQRRRP